MKLLRIIVHLLLIRPILYLIFGVNVMGRENLKGASKYILFANHNSHLDIFLLYLILPPEQINKTHPIAALDYFRKPVWLFKVVNFLFQPIWVDRTIDGAFPIKKIKKRLHEGHNIIIFPEGTRGQAGVIKEFRQGIGFIEHITPNTPIIQVYLEGPERAFPSKAAFPLPICNHITIGPPQIYTGKSKEISIKLHDNLKKLADEEQAFRQRRFSNSVNTPFTVAVIGIDGSGKSTLSRQLLCHFEGESCYISDGLELMRNGKPHSAQPLITNELRQALGRKAKNAKNLALYKIPKLAELLLRDHLCTQVQRWYRPDYIFMDGSPLLNMTAWANLYREDIFNQETCSKAITILTGNNTFSKNDIIFKQFPELHTIQKLHINHLTIPDAVIFLDVDPVISMKRIESRGEKIQAHENEAKLTKLRKAYHMVCDTLEKTHPVYRSQDGQSQEQLTEEATAFIQKIKRSHDAQN